MQTAVVERPELARLNRQLASTNAEAGFRAAIERRNTGVDAGHASMHQT